MAATGFASMAIPAPATSAAARSLFAFDMLLPLIVNDWKVATR
jgi:hypothetical protein